MMANVTAGDWIGVRVRTLSCPISTSPHVDTPREDVTAKCYGTISTYCPGIDEYFVIFEESFIAPTWISLRVDTNSPEPPPGVEIILDWVELEHNDINSSIDTHSKISRNKRGRGVPKDAAIKDEPSGESQLICAPVCGLCKHGAVAGKTPVQCSICRNRYFHDHCMPMSKMHLDEGQAWRCWFCTGMGKFHPHQYSLPTSLSL